MKRYGMLIGIDSSTVAEYKRLHAEVWPKVLEQIKRSNIRNYSIYLREPEMLLFSYFEYIGQDYEADMAKMADDPETQRWWAICHPLQRVLKTAKSGEHWAGMEEIFHCD